MKRRLRLAASLVLITGLALGIAVSYSDQDVDKGAMRFDGCPIYAGSSSLLNQVAVSWANSARLADQMGRVGAGMTVPRRTFIDEMLFAAMETDGIPHANLCTDEEFVRRVYIDLTGNIPTTDQVLTFLANPDRDVLVDNLLSTPEYQNRMVMWLGDHFLNTQAILGAGGRGVYNQFLRTIVGGRIGTIDYPEKPYTELITRMLANPLTTAVSSGVAAGAPLNFIQRSWENMANRYDVYDNTVADIGRAFLGQTLMCISCHNGINHLELVNWHLRNKRRSELWNMGAFLTGINFTLIRVGASATFSNDTTADGYYVRHAGATGGVRPQRNPIAGQDRFPAVYRFNKDVPDVEPIVTDAVGVRGELARIVTEDRQFARAAANYLWREFMGVGIVEAPDSFDLARLDPNNPVTDPMAPESMRETQPSQPALLEALTDHFIANNYSMKEFIRTLMKSSLYQLSAEFPGEWDGGYAKYFARHFVRRMPSETMFDSITRATERSVVNTAQTPITITAMTSEDPLAPAGNQQPQLQVRTFLNNFFRGSRDGVPRRSEGSIQQVLDLTNSQVVVLDRVRVGTHPQAGLANRVQAYGSDEEVINELFLATLSRLPRSEEMTAAQERFTAQGRAVATENLLLALLNHMEFLDY